MSTPVEPIISRRITVVFQVVDKSCLSKLYDAHLSGTQVCGGIPVIIASGDQLSVPQDFIGVLSDMDPEFPDKDTIAMLIEQACRFQQTH